MIPLEETLSPSNKSLVSLKSVSSLDAIMFSPTGERQNPLGKVFKFLGGTFFKPSSNTGDFVFGTGYGSCLIGVLYHMS